MHRMVTIITQRPDVTTEDFRRFMLEEYGPVYRAMPQVRGYTQHLLSTPGNPDIGEDPGPDAVVHIALDSPAAVQEALDTDAYRAAAERRTHYMARIDPKVLDAVVVLA